MKDNRRPTNQFSVRRNKVDMSKTKISYKNKSGKEIEFKKKSNIVSTVIKSVKEFFRSIFGRKIGSRVIWSLGQSHLVKRENKPHTRSQKERKMRRLARKNRNRR